MKKRTERVKILIRGKMKNKIKVISIVLFLSVLIMLVSCGKQKAEWKGTIEEGDGVQFVINPVTPLSKNAGRVLSLKEVMRIIDTGRNFYFKYLHSIKIAPNGSIFVKDDEELLQFDSKGKFNRNFSKKGQGPGEI